MQGLRDTAECGTAVEICAQYGIWSSSQFTLWVAQRNITFIAVSDGVEIDVVLIVGEEEKAEPWVKSVDGNDEEDAHYVPLLVRRTVVTQVHVDLKKTQKQQKKKKQ